MQELQVPLVPRRHRAAAATSAAAAAAAAAARPQLAEAPRRRGASPAADFSLPLLHTRLNSGGSGDSGGDDGGDGFGHEFSEHRHEWAGVENLDVFFSKVYVYFSQRGFARMVASHVANLVILAFTVLFSTFLLLFVDWRSVLNCHTENSCSHVALRPDILSNSSFGDVLVIMYFAVFSVYWVWNFIGFAYAIRDGLEMRTFFGQRLGISDTDLQTIKWSSIVRKIEEVQENFKISIIRKHNALDIANRILRKENYFIAMINRNVLDLRVPIFSTLGVSPGLGKSMEWNIRMCVLNVMFDEEFCIRKQFLDRPHDLKRHFQRMAVINMVLSPFILIFMVIFFFLKNAEQLHSKRSYMGPRQWTTLALWKFREFNELPHFFQARINTSYDDALAYMAQFPSSVFSIIAKVVAYVAGAIVGVLLFITVFLSSSVLEMKIVGHSLFWHLAVFSGVLAASRSMITSPEPGSNYEELLGRVFRHTHYMPPEWRGQAHILAVRSAFASMFKAKLVIFFQELLSVLTSPILLFTSLPRSSERIVAFVREHTLHIPGVGDVCAYSTFDFGRFGDHRFLPSALTIDSSLTAPTAQAKMEKSFVSFSLAHPHWTPDENGTRVLRSLVDMVRDGGFQVGPGTLNIEDIEERQREHETRRRNIHEDNHEATHDEEMSDSTAILMMDVSQLLQSQMANPVD